jgi:hypothetical protein
MLSKTTHSLTMLSKTTLDSECRADFEEYRGAVLPHPQTLDLVLNTPQRRNALAYFVVP